MHSLFMTMTTVLKIVPPFMLVFTALKLKLRFSKPITAIIFIINLMFMQMISGYLLISRQTSVDWRLIWSLTAMVMGYMLYFLLFKENCWKILFVKILTKGYMDCVSLVAQSVIEVHFEEVSGQAISLPLTIVFTAILLVTYYPTWKLLRTLLFPLLDSPTAARLWKYLWINPMIFYLLNRLTVSNQYVDYAPNEHLGSVVPLLWTIVTFVSYFIMLKILSDADKNNRLLEKLKISDVQTNMQKKQYEGFSETMGKTMEARHDLRHHLLALRGYLNAEDIEGLKQYLDKIVASTDDQAKVLCENPAVNMILQHYLEIAHSKKIQTSIEVQLAKRLPIEENDFCVIIGNLLENAVEGADTVPEGGERFINGKMLLTGEGKVIIMLRNSYGGKIRQDGELFVSQKHEGSGIGTASVCRIVRQYGGITRYTHKDNIFEASVLLSY